MTTIAQKLNKTLLGEIADITSSKRIFASDYVNEGVPFYRSREVIERQKGNDISTELYISKEKFESIKNKFGVPKKDDLLITSVGTLGVPYVVGENEVFYFKDGNLIWLRDFKKNIASPKFIYYAILNPETQQRLKGISIGSSQSAFTISALKDFYVLLPDISSQEKIVDILASYDSLIENNTRRIQILEQIAQAVYTEWFGSPESNWEIVPLRDALKSYIGGGWGKEELDKKYSDPAYVIRGTDIPKASVGDVSTCPLRYHTSSNLKTRVLQDGDLVFEVSGGSKGQPVGRSLLVTSKFLNQFNQNIICASFCKLIRPDQDKISPFQLYEQILSWYANGIIEKYQVQSTGISNFRFEAFIDEEKVALPPLEIRDKFDGVVSPLFDEICLLGNQSQNLRQMRDLLLPKLVSGEIEVSPI